MMRFLLMFLLFSTCTKLDEDVFFNKTIGTYTLNTTGVNFFRRATGYTLEEGDTLTFNRSGTLSGEMYDSNLDTSYEIPLAQLISIGKQYQGLFQILSKETYVAMGWEDNMWISTTNAKSHPNDVLFEHLVPIATQND